MPLRELIIVLLLMMTVLVIALVAPMVGSEFYVFIPAGRRGAMRGLAGPPTSPWVVGVMLASPAMVFPVSRRYAAILLTAVAALPLVAIPRGAVVFGWTPGVAQYALIVGFGALATYVWISTSLSED